MRWPTERLPNVKSVMDRYNLLDRTLARTREKINASGSPCIHYRNTGIDNNTGRFPTTGIKCYCWTTPTDPATQIATPDRSHFLCMGTGCLGTTESPGVGGYQRYGYEEIIFTTVHTHTKSSNNIIVGGDRNSKFYISGTSLSETITTGAYELPRFRDVNYFLINDSIDATVNRINYSYSLDGTTWLPITVVTYTETRLANRRGYFSLPELTSTGFTSTGTIRFRINLQKRYANSQSPQFNSIRFRYRNQLSLNELDSRFSDIDFPAFLASREQQSKEISQGEHGWITKFPLKWWVMPEVNIENNDIIKFYKGAFEGYTFVAKNVVKNAYGANLQILHRNFESDYIRDQHELLGIVHYLL